MKMLLPSLIGVLFFAGIANADSLKSDTSGFLQLFEQRFVQVNVTIRDSHQLNEEI